MNEKQSAVKEKIIVALDVDTEAKALELVKQLKNYAGVFKIGLQLFTACGPDIVKKIEHLGGKVFLDLKFHDIPNTVAKAVIEATELGVYMMTLHASGGEEMLKAAKEVSLKTAKELGITAPKLLAVTVLTSLDLENINKIGFRFESVKEAVLHLAAIANQNAGIDGIVCSPNETAILKDLLGDECMIVTPGVRPKESASHDQKRTATPSKAISDGADYIVIGRPITQAENPAYAAQKIIKEIEDSL
ncbi:MAG TPA: orotidine-5'-phosphate decarboxylase [Elusimicrobiales bacterium]|nr:orotidine-5'-phosphate decarboxylase [Elusimicrobiales bacterium]